MELAGREGHSRQLEQLVSKPRFVQKCVGRMAKSWCGFTEGTLEKWL